MVVRRLGFAVAVTLVLVSVMVSLAGAAGATVTLNPPDQAVTSGSEFTTEVMIQGGDAVLGFQFDAVFDAELLELTSFELGPWLGSSGRPARCPPLSRGPFLCCACPNHRHVR